VKYVEKTEMILSSEMYFVHLGTYDTYFIFYDTQKYLCLISHKMPSALFGIFCVDIILTFFFETVRNNLNG
jgi:hypothetical protein